MRRLLFPALVTLAILTPSSADAGCLWTPENSIQCTSNCWVTEQWVDGNGRPWMKWSCSGRGLEPIEGLAIIGVIIFVIAGACGAFSSTATDPLKEENKRIAEVQADTAKTNELTAKLHAAAEEADAHVRSLIEKSLKGDHHG